MLMKPLLFLLCLTFFFINTQAFGGVFQKRKSVAQKADVSPVQKATPAQKSDVSAVAQKSSAAECSTCKVGGRVRVSSRVRRVSVDAGRRRLWVRRIHSRRN